MFIMESKFSVESHITVEYKNENLNTLNGDDVGLIVMLNPKHEDLSETKLCVVTTHLKFNHRRGDVKLSQMRVLLAELDKFAFKSSIGKLKIYHPIVLCGDFNCEPHSPLYDFVAGGTLQCHGIFTGDIGKFSGKRDGFITNHDSLSLAKIGINVNTQYEEASSSSSPSSSMSTKADKKRVFSTSRKPDLVVSNVPHNSTAEELRLHWSENPIYPNSNEDPFSVSESLKINGIKVEKGVFFQPFKFVSTYTHFNEDGAKEITFQDPTSMCTVDYIFYTVKSRDYCIGRGRYQFRNLVEDELKHLGCYGLLFEDDLKDLFALPNAYVSSDHLCVIAKFLLTP